MKNFAVWMSASFVALALCACSSDSNSSSASNGGDNGGGTSGCNFKVTDNTWTFKYSLFSEKYIWVDETTVKHETWSGSYHMDADDETLTGKNREEFYAEILEECEGLQKASEVEGGHFI